MNNRPRYYIDRDSFFASGAVYFMAMAIFTRIVGCWGLWNDPNFLLVQILLPIACCLCIIVYILLLGRHLFELTVIPVVLGAVFFIVKALGYESVLKTVVCILLYIVVLIVYVGVVFGVIRSKWWLVPLFGLPLAYRLFVVDIRALQDVANPVTFASGMQELSVLCILTGMLLMALAMKRRAAARSGSESAARSETVENSAGAEGAAVESQTENTSNE